MDRTIRLLMLAVLIEACRAGNGYSYIRPAKNIANIGPVVNKDGSTKSVYFFADPDDHQRVPQQRTVSYKQVKSIPSSYRRTTTTYSQVVPQQQRTVTYRQYAPQQRTVSYRQYAPQQRTVSYRQYAPQQRTVTYSQAVPQQQHPVTYSHHVAPQPKPVTYHRVAAQQHTTSYNQIAPQQASVSYTKPVQQQPISYTNNQIVSQQFPFSTASQVVSSNPSPIITSYNEVAPQPQPIAYQIAPQQYPITSYQGTPQQLEYTNSQIAAPAVKQNLQVIFVKTPGYEAYTNALLKMAKEAIQSQTIVYVLSKEPDIAELTRRFQEIQATARKMPEVRFIKYKTDDEAIQAQKAIQAQYDESLPGPSHTIGTLIGTGKATETQTETENEIETKTEIDTETGSLNNNYFSSGATSGDSSSLKTTTNNEEDLYPQSSPPFLPSGVDVVPGSSYLPPHHSAN